VIRTARLAGVGIVTVVMTVAAAYFLLPFAAWAVVRMLTWTLNGSVEVAAAFGSGTDVWTIVTTLAWAVGRAVTTPQVSGAIALLLVVGGVAMFGLQRLLGSEEDSSR
jgi:hypothetical protein